MSSRIVLRGLRAVGPKFSNPASFASDMDVAGKLSVVGDAAFGALSTTAGQVRLAVQSLTASGNVTITSGLLTLAHNTTAITASKAAPVAGDVLWIVNTSASGTAAHKVQLPAGVTWNGTNRSVVLDAPGEAVLAVAISATRFFVIATQGTVSYTD